MKDEFGGKVEKGFLHSYSIGGHCFAVCVCVTGLAQPTMHIEKIRKQ